MLLDFSSAISSLYSVFEIITYFIVLFCALGFIPQLLYSFLMFLKKKKLKDSPKKYRYAILICARNEEDVIFDTISRIKNTINYPLDKLTFFVCCHNCTDNTYNEAKRAGAIPFILNDSNPKHAMVAYPFVYAVNKIKTEYKDQFDALTKIDADNILHKEFFNEMNKGLALNYQAIRGYIASSNTTQNMWTLASSTYYMRDSRVVCRVRERLHLDQALDGGAGQTFSMECLNKLEGQFLKSGSEDVEMSLVLIYKKIRIHFIEDAIVYNDQATTFKETAKRNRRMGHHLNLLFLENSLKMPFKAITLGKFSLIDLFLQLLFMPISLLSLGYILPYYLIILIFHCFNAFLPNGVSFMNGLGWMSQEMSFNNIITIAISGLSFLLVMALMYIITCLVTLKDASKKLNIPFKKTIKGAFISPLFMLVYNFSIFFGIISIPKWEQIKRNKNFDDIK